MDYETLPKLFNDKGYYDHMLEMLEHTIEEGFMKENNRELYYSSDNIEDVLNYIEKYNVKENKNYIIINNLKIKNV